MQPARMYTCPNCGGPVQGGDLHCGHCRAPLATVRCARCFHMNPPDNTYCAGCGGELGLEPIGEPGSLACPHCSVRLETFRGGPGLLSDCPNCGGQFVEHDLLHDLLERREVLGAFVPKPAKRNNPLSEPVRYVPCPICGTLMNRKNFGRQSGIIVDVCTAHGTWFDKGELPNVLSFVQNGGLARARRAAEEERDRIAQTRRELSASRPPLLGDRLPSSRTSLLGDLAEAGLALSSFVRDLIQRRY